MQQFKIYNSSAGSGKTFTLTKEYLKLALSTDDSTYFKRILAITFTNDAANEMKERILSSLKEFSQPKELLLGKSKELLKMLVEEMNSANPHNLVDEEILQERSSKTFSKIINEYSDFAVSTIDSFTNKVVTAFTEELGLPYNYEIDLDTEELLQNASERVISKVGEKGNELLLTETLEEYILEKADEGKQFAQLPSDLAGFGRQLLDEKVTNQIKLLKNLDLKEFSVIRKTLYKRIDEIRNIATIHAKNSLDEIENAGLSAQSFAKGEHGIAGYFGKIETSLERSLSSEPTKSFLEALEKDSWASSKAKANEKQAVNSLKNKFYERYVEIENQKGEYLLLKSISKNLYKVSILNEIEKELEYLKKEENIVHISDFNKKITEIVLNQPVPFIYERLGEKYNHILIDEFQDTSALQWNNLMPLVENSLSKGFFNLLVGDAKQAIYGWRGGDMQQIINLTNKDFDSLINAQHGAKETFLLERYTTLKNNITTEVLNTNYRSKAEIIEFNNDFFSKTISSYSVESPLLVNAYKAFEQKLSTNTQTGGHVQIDFINAANSDLAFSDNSGKAVQEYHSKTLLQIQNNIEEILKSGYSYKDIAVLNRNNKHSKDVAEFLTALGIKVVSRDSLLLRLADSVKFIITIFKVLNRPTKSLLKYESLHLFHKYVLNQPIEDIDQKHIDLILKEDETIGFFKYFQRKGFPINENQFSDINIYDQAEKLASTFNLFEKPNQSVYLYRFLDVVLDFTTSKNNHLADFLEYWELKKNKFSINTPSDDAITVASIHKSKGLEYPIVILSFADWSFTPRWYSLLWANVSQLDKNNISFFKETRLNSFAVYFTKELSRTALGSVYEYETIKYFIEELNALYVALTRSKERLYIITESDDFEKNKTGTIKANKLFHEYLVIVGKWQPETIKYIVFKGKEQSKISKEKSTNEKALILQDSKPLNWNREIWKKRHPDNDFILDTENFNKEIEYYKKAYYALKRLHYINDLEIVVQRMFLEGLVEKHEIELLVTYLKSIISDPNIELYFSKDSGYSLKREIIFKTENTQNIPERIVMKDREVVILLFRTHFGDKEDKKIAKKYDANLRKMGYNIVKKIIVNLIEKATVMVD